MSNPKPRKVGEDTLLTVSEVSAMLSLGKTKTYELLNSGKLPRAKFDGAVRIWKSDVQRLADRSTSKPS